MSITEELRRLLDERGVEWTYSIGPFPQTNWEVGDVVWHAKELEHGFDVTTRYLTPEQAVEATLGRGTCRNTAPSYLDFLCCGCGFVHYHSDANDSGDGNEWRYCPNCGRKVVDA